MKIVFGRKEILYLTPVISFFMEAATYMLKGLVETREDILRFGLRF
jgi:hypothetical protein